MRAVYTLARRLMGNHDDADDVAQETFVRAYQALDRYDESFAFYTWLRTIATRVAWNELAKRKRRRTSGGETFDLAAERVAGAAADPVALAAEAETRERLRRAVDALPGDFRAVVALRAFEDLSYAEIAEVLDIPIGTVMSRLSRARSLLRQAWSPHDPLPTEREP